MCESCWCEYGRPNIVNEKTEAALALVRQVYAAPKGDVGGTLHNVLDDWNLEDRHIYWCLSQCGEIEAWFEKEKFTVTPTIVERACAGAFLDMTLVERASTLEKFRQEYVN